MGKDVENIINTDGMGERHFKLPLKVCLSQLYGRL